MSQRHEQPDPAEPDVPADVDPEVPTDVEAEDAVEPTVAQDEPAEAPEEVVDGPADEPLDVSVDDADGAPVGVPPGEPVDAADAPVEDAAAVDVASDGEARPASDRSSLLAIAAVLVILISVVGALVVVRGGISIGIGDDHPAAYTLYGEEVSRGTLAERLDGLVGQDVIDTLDDDADATPEQRQELATGMSTVIFLDILDRAAADAGITVTDEEVDAQVDEFVASAAGGDAERFEAEITEAGLTMEAVRTQLRTALLAEELVAGDVDPVEEADVQAFYDQQFALPQVAHVLVDSEDEALDVLDRLAAGEEFAVVAQEVSTDPGSAARGGELGPLQPGQFVPEFEEAALALDPGEVSDPVESDFGFHVITVGDPVPLEAVEEQIAATIEEQQLTAAFTALAQELDEGAAVTVDPALGTWAGLIGGGVLPPVGAEPEFDIEDLPLPQPTE